jgi:hypothetical protein
MFEGRSAYIPEDAVRGSMATDLDMLVIVNFVFCKTEPTSDDQGGYIDGLVLA